jgi:hypothetical protein
MTQCDASFVINPLTGVIRPAMRELIGHQPQDPAPVKRCSWVAKEPGYTTHYKVLMAG